VATRFIFQQEDSMERIALSLAVLVCLMCAAPVGAQTTKAPADAGAGGARTAAAAVVNINSASAAEFEALPGIGAKMAARIVEYRQKNGPFKKVEELMNVRGLGEKNFLKLKGQLTIGAPRPADRPDR
jgi:competence protein ComEA